MALLSSGSAACGGFARAPDPPASKGGQFDSGRLRLRSIIDSGQTVWILTRPESSFQEQLASKELARGLRNLGLGREPIEAARSEAQPSPADSIFS